MADLATASAPLPLPSLSAAAAANNANRKRARESLPSAASATTPTTTTHRTSSPLERTKALQLKDPLRRNGVLNELLQSSAQGGSSLTSNAILMELARIVVEDCVQVNEQDLNEASNNNKKHATPLFDAAQLWKQTPTPRTDALAKAFGEKLSPYTPYNVHRNNNESHVERLATLNAVLMILRNLSFVAANQRLVAYSPVVLDVIVASLYQPHDGSDDAAAAPSALSALINLAPVLDWTGQRILTDRLLYMPTSDSYPIPSDNDGSKDGNNDDGVDN